MTGVRYVEGLVLAACALVPVVVGSVAWRRRLLPTLTGPPAVLATVIVVISSTLVVAETLGTVGLLSLAPVTIALALAGGVGWFAARTWWSPDGRTATAPVGPAPVADPGDAAASSRGTTLLAVIATAVVTAEWASRTIDALHHGMTTVDTLWYHMPFAARFVQLGSTTSLHYVDTEPVVQFYPANSELLHALGILFLGNDVLSPLVNLSWMTVVLLAAWCIGRPFGVAPVSLIGAAFLLGTPGLVATQPGGGYTDVVGLALFLSAIALLVATERDGFPRVGGLALAALAAGLAFGTKFTFVGPVAVLTVGVLVVCPRGHRIRRGALWVGLVVLTGAYWYLRNWVAIGNPLPSLSSLGPISLPSPPITAPNSTFSHDMFDVHLWRKFFIPGLRSSFGPAWVVLVAAAVIGVVLVLLSRRRSWLWRMVAAVGALCFVVFAYTPQFLGLPGEPFYFVYNLRYVTPALLVGLVVLPVAPRLVRGRAPVGVGAGLLAALGVTQIDSTIWPGHLFSGPFAAPTSGADAVGGLVVGASVLAVGLVLVLRAPREGRRTALPRRAGAVVLLVVVALGYPLQQFYLSNRYESTGAGSVVAPKTVAWVQTISHARIALNGPFMNLQYPYYGKYLTNYVQYVAKVAPNGGMGAYPTCEGWLRALHRGHYDYVIVLADQEKRWTGEATGATLIRTEVLSREGTLDTFRLGPGFDGSGCPA